MTNPIILLMEINIMFLEYIIFETRLADVPELGSLIGNEGGKRGGLQLQFDRIGDEVQFPTG